MSAKRDSCLRPGTLTPLLIAGAFVVVLWVVVLGQVEHSVFGRVPILDEVYYLDHAAGIADGALVPADPFFMSPLYPYLIAAVGGGGGVPTDRVFDGPELRGLRILQIVFWCGTLILIRLLSGLMIPATWSGRRRLLSLWLPVVLFLFYRPAAVYTMAVLLAAALVFLVTLAAYLMLGSVTERRPLWWPFLLGVVLGLAVLLRGTTLLLVPVAVWFGLRRGGGWPGSGLLLAGVALVLAAPVAHNSRAAGRLVGPSLNGGVNLFIGNGPEANGFYVAAVPGDWRHDPAGRAFWAEKLDRSAVSLAEADRLWSAEAWRAIRRDPGRAVALMGRKIWLQLQGWEIDQLTPLAGWTETVPLLRIMVVPYALLVVLALVGLAAGRWRRRPAGVLVAVLTVLLLGQSLFFVVSRYRQVLVPLWAVLAGLGAGQLWGGRRRDWAAAMLGLALVVPWGLSPVRQSWAALGQANEALRWAHLAAADGSELASRRAEDLYRQSLAEVSDRPASWLGLAATLEAGGHLAEQANVLQQGLAKVRDPLPLQKALLAAYLAQGQSTAALALVPAILAGAPHDADTLHNYSVLLARAGRMNEALEAARTLREAHPTDARGHVDVGILLARTGRREAARAAFIAGLRQCPDNPELLHNLSLLAP